MEAPRAAGSDAHRLRVLRPTLGPALPARANVVGDPSLLPSASGLAVVREEEGYRLLTVAVERSGAMVSFCENPDREVAFDRLHPSDVAAVVSAIDE